MIQLPEKFLERMKSYFTKEEYDEFISSYEEAPEKGIRLNTLKCDEKTLKEVFGDKIKKSPFSPLSYYIDDSIKIGSTALHAAGAVYSQEPSASSAVTVLEPQPGEKILDMCAAPGGKSTQIAAYLKGEGLLWSNEVVHSRANILLSNIERMGIRNAVVSSVYPDKLADKLEGYFDRVLVDAPCSGEGMFRKNDEAITEWSPEHVEACAERQLNILDSAALCLKEGGTLVYSTCTFSKEENEGVVSSFLTKHTEFELVPINVSFGRGGYDNMPVLRIFPMDGGEGHFVAKFRKTGVSYNIAREYKQQKKDDKTKLCEEIFAEIFNISPWGKIEVVKDKAVILPNDLPDISGLNVLRAGVPLAEIISKGKMRAEPHHGLFMAAKKEELKNTLDLSSDSEELRKFLHGEEIDCDKKGYTAVLADGITIGFGKASGGKLKNKYPKGLRLNY